VLLNLSRCHIIDWTYFLHSEDTSQTLVILPYLFPGRRLLYDVEISSTLVLMQSLFLALGKIISIRLKNTVDLLHKINAVLVLLKEELFLEFIDGTRSIDELGIENERQLGISLLSKLAPDDL
jgi:hypothetical protein